jgi:hypothetical protein
MDFKGDKNLPSEGNLSLRPRIVRFYDMLKVPAEYDRDTSPAKLRDISRKVSVASLLGVCAGIFQRALVD